MTLFEKKVSKLYPSRILFFRNNISFSLFFSDAPTINKVLPIITPNNLHITSRGRIVYGLLSIDKYTNDIKEYLSPEFIRFITNKDVKFSESDIEKVSAFFFSFFCVS